MTLEELKQSWCEDPCWDLEETEGFGEYREELLTFAEAKREEWRIAREERDMAAARSMGLDTRSYLRYKAQAAYKEQAADKARYLLSYYIVNQCMGGGSWDNTAEVRSIVNYIIDAAVAAVKAEMIKNQEK